MKGVKFFEKVNSIISISFIGGYILLNYLIAGSSLGANSRAGLMPFFLFFIGVIIYFSKENFLNNWTQKKSKILIFFSVMINVFFFTIGKVNKESLLFKGIKETVGVDFKIVFIIYSLLLITLFFVKKYRSNVLRYYYIFPVFFCEFTFFIPVLFPEPHIDLFKIIKNSNQLLHSRKDPYQHIYPDIYNREFDYAYQKQPVKLV